MTCDIKTVKLCLNKHAYCPRFVFYRGFFKNKNNLELVSRPYFLQDFLNKNFYFVIMHRLAKFYYQTMFTSEALAQRCSVKKVFLEISQNS